MSKVEKKLRLIVPALKNAVKECTACGACLQNCYLNKYSPKLAKKIMSSIREYVFSDFKRSLPGLAKTVIWRCCTDESCHSFCPKGISKSILMIGLRFVLLQKGEAPFLIQLIESSMRRSFQKDPEFRLQRAAMRIIGPLMYPSKWLKERSRKEVTERIQRAKNPQFDRIKKGATLFMPGCGHTYGMPHSIELTMRILDKAGVDYATIGTPEFCCGGVFAVAGFLKGSLLIGERTGKALKKLKPGKVITACPGCFSAYTNKEIPTGVGTKTFKFPLSEILEEAGIEVLHLSEFLFQLIKSRKIKFERRITRPIAVLNSCSTGGRAKTLGKGDVSQFQHEILKSIPGVEYRELPLLKETARCCGITVKLTEKVASPFSLLNPDLAFNSQREVINDALSQEIRDVTTICGGCAMMYGDGLKQMGNPVKFWDMQELLAHAMGINVHPRQTDEIFNWMKLSPPYFKIGMLSAIPRLIETAATAVKYILS
ncbi:MAG: (Fe-S)-binding protein [Candidatus Helarchaeota archaeon]|nr:(Fe-S)-binding protein [Candidatus Helarchaeota archaeon]